MINNGGQKSDATSIPHSQQDFQKVSYTPPDPMYASVSALPSATEKIVKFPIWKHSWTL